MPLTGEVSDFEFKLMLIGDVIALSTIFAVLIFTVHFILVKFKPSWFYHKKRKTEDIDVNQMVRRMSTKFKHLVIGNPPLEKRVSRQVSFAELPGRLFSPSGICKKLSHHFLLHFPIGMGSYDHHAKYQGVFP